MHASWPPSTHEGSSPGCPLGWGTKQSGVGDPHSMHGAIDLGRVSLGGQTHLHTERKHQPRRQGLGAASPERAEESGRLGALASGLGLAPVIERQAAVRRLPEKGLLRLT